MKYLIFGDVHSRSLDDLNGVLEFNNFNAVVCTGYFDSPDTIRQFMKLEGDFFKRNKDVYLVPGNHDFALINNDPITSPQLREQGKTISDYYKELSSDKLIHRYLETFASVYAKSFKKHFYLDEPKYEKKYSTVVLHGGYSGDYVPSISYGENVHELWYRMRTEEGCMNNFKIMYDRGDKIMIRGHDHISRCVSYDLNHKTINTHIPAFHGKDYLLKPDKIHIINPGAFVDGFYSILDTDEEQFPLLKYYNL